MTFLLSLDAALEGRRLRILIVLALFQGVLAPLLDGTLSGVRRLGGLRSTARALDEASFAGFEGFSLVAIVVVLVAGGTLAAARLAALRAPDEDGEGATPFSAQLYGLWRIAWAEWRLFRRRDGMEQVLGAGFIVFSALQTVRAVLSFGRWVLWETIVEGFGLERTPVGGALEAVFAFEGVLALLAGALLTLVGLVLLGWALRLPKAARVAEGRVREVRLLRAHEPLVGVGEERRAADLASAFHGELVARLLRDLATWVPPADARWESHIRDDLASYLIDRDYNVAIEFSLRAVRRRIDLVVDDCVAIEIKWELRYAGEKDRARSQVVDYARAWSERGPVIALVVATERPHIEHIAVEAKRWNSEFEPEKTAPLLVFAHNRGLVRREPERLPAP